MTQAKPTRSCLWNLQDTNRPKVITKPWNSVHVWFYTQPQLSAVSDTQPPSPSNESASVLTAEAPWLPRVTHSPFPALQPPARSTDRVRVRCLFAADSGHSLMVFNLKPRHWTLHREHQFTRQVFIHPLTKNTRKAKFKFTSSTGISQVSRKHFKASTFQAQQPNSYNTF